MSFAGKVLCTVPGIQQALYVLVIIIVIFDKKSLVSSLQEGEWHSSLSLMPLQTLSPLPSCKETPPLKLMPSHCALAPASPWPPAHSCRYSCPFLQVNMACARAWLFQWSVGWTSVLACPGEQSTSPRTGQPVPTRLQASPHVDWKASAPGWQPSHLARLLSS